MSTELTPIKPAPEEDEAEKARQHAEMRKIQAEEEELKNQNHTGKKRKINFAEHL